MKAQDFDLAFAHEAMARAHAVAGNAEECRQHIALATEASEQIAEEEDQKYFLEELATVRPPETP